MKPQETRADIKKKVVNHSTEGTNSHCQDILKGFASKLESFKEITKS